MKHFPFLANIPIRVKISKKLTKGNWLHTPLHFLLIKNLDFLNKNSFLHEKYKRMDHL